MKSPNKDPLAAKGRRIREEVLGAEYVKSRAQAADEYTEGFNEFTTKAAWALIWSRPGLTRKQRSLVTLGALTALHQQTELRLHIRAAAIRQPPSARKRTEGNPGFPP